MTDEELKAIEARAAVVDDGYDYDAGYVISWSWAEGAESDLKALIAEVRRLRGLVKRVEYRGSSGSAYWYTVCSWCTATSSDGSKPPHDDNCPAFSPDGSVK